MMKGFSREVSFQRLLSFKVGSLIFFIFFLQLAISQETNKDSLKTKTFKELIDLSEIAYQKGDTTLLSTYRNYHLYKAKLEHNNLEIARAYNYFITWENFEIDIMYSDSIINVTKNSDHEAYPTNGYLLKANLYYYNSDFNKALDNFIIANKWAEKKQYKPLQTEATHGIAAIKNIWGLHEEALEIYRTNYSDIINTPNYITTHYDDYILLATDLSLSYIRNHKPDSALVILEQAMKQAELAKHESGYYDLGKVQATANYYLKKYPQTQDSLIKFLPRYSGLVLSDSYYMLGKIAQYQNDYSLLMNYFEKIDSIHKRIHDPFPELKEVYNELIKEAIKKGNKDQQLYYIDQLITVDSILNINYTTVNNKVRSDYDIPKLKKEKQELKSELNSKQQQLLVLAILMVLVIVGLIIFGYMRQQTLKKRFHRLLQTDTIESSEVKPIIEKVEPIGISKHIVKDILNQLDHFENTKKYISKDITLNSLAKTFGTNSSYLSSVINQVKQTNFSSYLKDLRITHAINSIKQDRQYLKYSINGLADEFGFITAESFSRAFRDKAGIKPSYFLDELRKKGN